MWLVVLPLVLTVGLVCGDASLPLHSAHTTPAHVYPAPSDTNFMPGSDLACPAAEDITPCVCTVWPNTTIDLDCSHVASEDQLAQIFAGYFPFRNFDQLIIIKNQNLKVLRPGVFGNVTFQYIQITNGQLVEVQERALSGSFTTAITIDISVNRISSFPFNELEEFSQLQIFYIHQNNIQDFPFLKSSTISIIKFDSNPLTNFPATALQDLPSLSICYFHYTGISQIESGTFTGLPHLYGIILSGNNIQHIPTGAIQLNDQLDTFVYLANNSISSIEVGAVTGLKQDSFFLFNNLLEELDEAVFRPIFDEGTKPFLGGNPLRCGCDMAWLITNQTYMDQLSGYERCYDGERLTNLDPHFYEQNC